MALHAFQNLTEVVDVNIIDVTTILWLRMNEDVVKVRLRERAQGPEQMRHQAIERRGCVVLELLLEEVIDIVGLFLWQWPLSNGTMLGTRRQVNLVASATIGR